MPDPTASERPSELDPYSEEGVAALEAKLEESTEALRGMLRLNDDLESRLAAAEAALRGIAEYAVCDKQHHAEPCAACDATRALLGEEMPVGYYTDKLAAAEVFKSAFPPVPDGKIARKMVEDRARAELIADADNDAVSMMEVLEQRNTAQSRLAAVETERNAARGEKTDALNCIESLECNCPSSWRQLHGAGKCDLCLAREALANDGGK